MNMGTGFTKLKIITVIIAVLVIIALIVAMVFGLKGCRKQDLPVQDAETSQTDGVADDNTPKADPEDPSKPTEATKPTKPAEPTEASEPTEGFNFLDIFKPAGTNKPADTSKPTDTSKPAGKTFTVTFKDFDGTVLDTQKVKKGKGASAPADPTRENFTFAGWDQSFDKITSDLVVTATYTTTKTVVYAEHVSVKEGTDEVTMNIRILNNPSIMGAVLKVSVDDQAFSFKEAKKTEYPGFTLTSPGPQTTVSPYTFVLDALEIAEADEKDGTLFTVTFKVQDTAKAGKYEIKLSCDNGAIFDKDYKYPAVCLENGSITIQ